MMLRTSCRLALALLLVAIWLVGCGGGGGGGGSETTGTGSGGTGGGGGGTPAASGIGEAEAQRLLAQASFGAKRADIARVGGMSADAWLSEQFAATPTYHLPECQRLRTAAADQPLDRNARTDAWWGIALTAPDQLRQRVALALSEIMVVSDQSSALDNAQEGLCFYYDILVRNAFGDFRGLLEEVTLSPAMGLYLSMFGNAKPDAASGRRADENYARESMQLFTVGLTQLNADGSSKRDSSGNPVPSYTQAEIEGLARVYTGWAWNGGSGFRQGPANYLKPMQAYENFHDTADKTIIGATPVAAGGTAQQDLDRALDTLFLHPNLGPFIGRQLIQRLVTSNPSPAYIARVAAVFDDNGRGRRGDLQATVRAILLDDEARRGVAANANFGKPREPLLMLASLWRAMDARPPSASGRYSYRNAQNDLGQSPLSAPSVFNFFSPFYGPSGGIREAGLVAPEFQLANESSTPALFNRLYVSVYSDFQGNAAASPTAVLIDLAPLIAKAGDPAALAGDLDRLLLAGQMSTAFKQVLVEYLTPIATTSEGLRLRAQEALYLVLTSPQYQVQR